MAVYLIDKIKQKNNGSFPLVDASDVAMPDGSRLDAYLSGFLSALGLPTPTEADNGKVLGVVDGKWALVKAGAVEPEEPVEPATTDNTAILGVAVLGAAYLGLGG